MSAREARNRCAWRMPRAPIVELASPPYGMDMQEAVRRGLQVCVEGGLPGRYAPMDAGGALFDVLARGMAEIEEGEEKADE